MIVTGTWSAAGGMAVVAVGASAGAATPACDGDGGTETSRALAVVTTGAGLGFSTEGLAA